MNARRAALLFGLPLLCIAAGLGAGLLALRGAWRASYIEGIVLDSSGVPLAGAEVAVSNRGWGYIDGRLVWDKDFVYSATTGPDGRFRIEYQVGSSAHVLASAGGHQPYDGWHDSNSTITIRLKKVVANYRRLPHGMLEIGMRDFKPYGWDFSEGRTTSDPGAADLFPDIAGLRSGPAPFLLQAPGGIIFVPEATLGGGEDPLVFVDTAPTDGYAPSIMFDPQQRGGIYFVKTRLGKFAKLVSTSTTSGSEADARRGTWGIRLEYVYNPDGSPNLVFQR